MEFWTLSSFDAMAMGCVFALGALVGFATRRVSGKARRKVRVKG